MISRSEVFNYVLPDANLAEIHNLLDPVSFNWDQQTQIAFLEACKFGLDLSTLMDENKVPEINLSGADLSGKDLRNAHMMGAQCEGTNFSGANMEKVFLYEANLEEANFRNANLERANFGAIATNVDFSGANLRNAYMDCTNFRFSDFTGADFTDASVCEAEFLGAILPEDHLHYITNSSAYVDDDIYEKYYDEDFDY